MKADTQAACVRRCSSVLALAMAAAIGLTRSDANAQVPAGPRAQELVAGATVDGDGVIGVSPPFVQLVVSLAAPPTNSTGVNTGQTRITLRGSIDGPTLAGRRIDATILMPGVVRNGSSVNIRAVRTDEGAIDPVSVELCAPKHVSCQLAYYRSYVRMDPFSWRDRSTLALLGPLTAGYALRMRRGYPYWIQGMFGNVFRDHENSWRTGHGFDREIEVYGKERLRSDGPTLARLLNEHRTDDVLAEVVSEMPTAEGHGFIGLWPYVPLRIYLRTRERTGWLEMYDIDRRENRE